MVIKAQYITTNNEVDTLIVITDKVIIENNYLYTCNDKGIATASHNLNQFTKIEIEYE